MAILNTSNTVLLELVIKTADVDVNHKVYIDEQYVGNLCVE